MPFCAQCRRVFNGRTTCPTDGEELKRLPRQWPAPGSLVDGRFQMLSPIAAGGMSRIYNVREVGRARPMAIKVLDPRLGLQPYTVERFLREGRVAVLLDHPNVVRVQTFGLTGDGYHVIVMELLGGDSLGAILARVGRFPWMRVVHIALELCDALGHAHGRLVIHRDLKPDNVQLLGDAGPNERVLLLDFGVAYQSADSDFSEPAPGSTHVSGTPAYMAPEQIRGRPLDGRCDLYALGVLMYEMLSGKRPFDGGDSVELCRRQLFERPPDLEHMLRGTDVPTELTQIVAELMTKSRSSRVASVGALIARLLQVLPEVLWPRRLRRAWQTNPDEASKGVHPSSLATSGTRRLMTADDLLTSNNMHVAVLHLVLERGPDEPSGMNDWPVAVRDLLRGWSSVVEESGGLLHHPEPEIYRVVFGLFQPSGEMHSYVAAAVQHAQALLTLVDEGEGVDGMPTGIRVGLALSYGTYGDVRDGMVHYRGGSDADLAFRLARLGQPGLIVVDAATMSAARGLGTFEALEPMVWPGSTQQVLAAIMTPHPEDES